MSKEPRRPPYIEEGEVLYPFQPKPPREAIREMHIFTGAYFEQFQPPAEEEHPRWLGKISGVTY